jgi:hypothetical protein
MRADRVDPETCLRSLTAEALLWAHPERPLFPVSRGVRVNRRVAARLVEAARTALPTGQAVIARQILQAGLALLGDLEAQLATAEERIAALLPATEYHVLTTTMGGGVTQAAGYAAALVPHARWGSPAKVYRAAGSLRRPAHRPGVRLPADS